MDENLGKLAIDQVSGFKGVITSAQHNLDDTIYYLVTSKSAVNGDLKEYWFNSNRLDFSPLASKDKTGPEM